MSGKKRKRGRKLAEKKPIKELAESPAMATWRREATRKVVVDKPLEKKPIEAKPVEKKITEEEQIHWYLVKHGATKAPKIAKELNLSLSAVTKALTELKRQGKISLR